MAAAFGTQPAVAAFWMSFRFANLLRRLFGEGALHSAFVPHFEQLRLENPAKASRFFYDLSTGVTFLLLVVVVIAEIILGFFLIQGGSREVIQLTMLMLPAVVFISLYALNTSFLNCEQSYFLPSFAPTVLNLCWIGATICLWRFPIHEAMRYLAMLLVFAFAFQWIVTLPRVLNLLEFETEKKTEWKEIFAILRPFLLAIVGVAATQINSALDAIFARIADPEGPAYLWYALRLQQLPLALVGVGMAGALLPPLSRAIQQGDREKTHHFFSLGVRQTIGWMLPTTLAIFMLGLVSVNLVYGHGKFSESAVIETTRCLWAYGAGLIPMSLVLILAASFYARKNYLVPTTVSLCCVALNISLNALFVFGFHLGAVSIAIATSISATLNAMLLYFLQKERVEFKGGVKLAALCLLPVMIAYFLRSETLANSLMGQFKQFGLQAGTFGAALLVPGYFMYKKRHHE